ncbi:hypothetical protein [Streptomyces zaomyceticus]|uniref:hypothetical protein n=1 Tax=Streptomyces zaomyceticus TaxID=68286 RepID=UPI002E16509D|nr:hypothetical protein OG237_15945 [Streptomyces zaomyceticus]
MTTQQKKPVRRPDDKPFDFNLDAVEAEVDLTPFVFQYSGRRWTMQHLQGLDIMPLMAAAQNGDAAAMLGAFREALGAAWTDFQKVGLPQYKLQPLFEAYSTHCGTQPGESPASTDS